jgi:hypothetical protein
MASRWADLTRSYVTEDGGRLQLNADGTFTSTGVSNFGDFAQMPLSGPGQWSLNNPGAEFGDIRVSFTAPPGYTGGYMTSLEISGSREHPWLFWYVDDPDSCDLYRFTEAS